MTTISSPTSTEPQPAAAPRPDRVIRGTSPLPLLWGGIIGLIGGLQLIAPILTLAAFFGGGFAPGMALDALVGGGGAMLCFYLAYVLLSVPRPALVFRADRLEVARLFGKYSTVSYAELKADGAKPDATSKAPVRLRELSIPGWVMTKAENRDWREELGRRAPWVAGEGSGS